MAIARPNVDLEQLSEVCLYAIYTVFATDRADSLSAQEIQTTIADVPRNFIKLALESLEEDSLIRETRIKTRRLKPLSALASAMSMFPEREYVEVYEDSGKFTITKRGLAEVEQWAEEHYKKIGAAFTPGTLIENSPIKLGTTGPSNAPSAIPASNRYVSAKDNQPSVEEVRAPVQELIQAVTDNKDNDFDDKEGRLAELAALDLLLAQPQLSVPLIEKILTETVSYLATRFANEAIGLVAKSVLVAAARFLGIHV